MFNLDIITTAESPKVGFFERRRQDLDDRAQLKRTLNPNVGGAGGTWVNACCVCAAGLPYPILVYFVANYRPHLSHFLECNFRDPNLVTFYLFIYLVNPLKRSSINYLRRTITIQ